MLVSQPDLKELMKEQPMDARPSERSGPVLLLQPWSSFLIGRTAVDGGTPA